MELANLTLSVGTDVEHTVPKRAITPAEALLLATIHKTRKKGLPLSDIKITGLAQSIAKLAETQQDNGTYEGDLEVPDPTDWTKTRTIKAGETVYAGTVLKLPVYRPRTGKEEVARLRTIYHKKHVDALFPTPSSPIPETFAEAEKLWAEVPNVASEEGQIGNWTDVPGALPVPKEPSPITKKDTSKA